LQLLLQLLLLLIVCAHAIVGNFIVAAVNFVCVAIAIRSSSSIGMQSGVVQGRAVALSPKQLLL
jgi:hypothetical protein